MFKQAEMAPLSSAFLIAMLLFGLVDSQLTSDHHDHFNMVFMEADKDNNGILDKSEFINSFTVYDGNKDGTVTKKEYMDHNTVVMPEHLMIVDPMFDKYDMDRNGQLNISDYQKFYPLMDANNDNLVTEQEFHNYWVSVFGDHSMMTMSMSG
ncbi:unnamed protein product [Lymnaea stagnalis]|uniref:EF-hand domain-containing protein n=1 Tax=Lymnaea stagnalis TaxID=6523 RepID=A0AAV2HYJ6_LYMST